MIHNKILRKNQLRNIVVRLRDNKKTIAFTNGCFDILHYGHIRYLEKAKKKADILIVGVNSDSSIRKIKGDKRPIVKADVRAAIVAALESVNYVVIFNEETPFKLIHIIKPDFLIKGADWKKSNIVGKDFVKSYGGKVICVNFTKGFSTSNLIEDILRKFSK